MSNTSVNSFITGRNRDCLMCRLVSGSGLIGAGLYVGHYSKNFKNTAGKSVMVTIAGALAILGTTRIFDLPPFQHTNLKQT